MAKQKLETIIKALEGMHPEGINGALFKMHLQNKNIEPVVIELLRNPAFKLYNTAELGFTEMTSKDKHGKRHKLLAYQLPNNTYFFVEKVGRRYEIYRP